MLAHARHGNAHARMRKCTDTTSTSHTNFAGEEGGFLFNVTLQRRDDARGSRGHLAVCWLRSGGVGDGGQTRAKATGLLESLPSRQARRRASGKDAAKTRRSRLPLVPRPRAHSRTPPLDRLCRPDTTTEWPLLCWCRPPFWRRYSTLNARPRTRYGDGPMKKGP